MVKQATFTVRVKLSELEYSALMSAVDDGIEQFRKSTLDNITGITSDELKQLKEVGKAYRNLKSKILKGLSFEGWGTI